MHVKKKSIEGLKKLGVAAILLLWVFLLVSTNSSALFGRKPPRLSNPEYTRPVTAVLLPRRGGRKEVHHASESAEAWIDLSNVSGGYVAAACIAPVDVRLQVRKGEQIQNYVLPPTGETQFYPLSMGNGTYTITVYLHLYGSKYEAFLRAEEKVVLADEFSPFLLPNVIVDYGEDSEVVQLARHLAVNASTDLEVVQQVYYWVSQNIAYDNGKAEASKGMPFTQMPDLGQVLADRKGICIDYAALTAALLRINGIPCRLEIGVVDTVDGETIAHAWNSVWIEEAGAISQSLNTQPGAWNRIDLTMAAYGYSAYKTVTGDSGYVLESIH